MQKIPCKACDGTGQIELSQPLQQTLRCLRVVRGGMRLGDIHAALERRYGKSLALATVFKRLKGLVLCGVVAKEKKIYTLCVSAIKSSAASSDR